MHRTNIYLDKELCAALDRLAAEEGTSRAELIRRVLGRWLAGRANDEQEDLDAINGSFGVLGHREVTERQPGDRERHLDRLWGLRA